MTFCKHSLRLTTWLFQKSPTGFVLSKRSKTLWQTVIVSSMDPLSIEFYWVLGLRATLLLTPNRWPPLVTSRAACEAEIWRIRLRLPADTSWKRLLCFRIKENTVIYHKFCQTSNYGNCSIWCLDLTLHTPKTHIYIQYLYTLWSLHKLEPNSRAPFRKSPRSNNGARTQRPARVSMMSHRSKRFQMISVIFVTSQLRPWWCHFEVLLGTEG